MEVNLILFKKDGSTRAFHLPSTVTVIGRRKDCDLCVPLMSVSRRHCKLNLDQGRLTVRDLGSKNGTFLNGVKVSESPVKPGDVLKIGTLYFGVQIDGRPENIEIMRPAEVPPAAQPPQKKTVPAEDSFEDIIDEISDIDLNQTLGESSMGINP
ncbi:MAG TPA: FHA domain-containing protein [Anaerohalosphaeraceae bacterium]|nr:FHA domain-containing protein [Anaerohalosphaeraceae bacterium]